MSDLKKETRSVSYREARDQLIERFTTLGQQDRVDAGGLHADIASVDGYCFALAALPEPISPSEWISDLLPLVAAESESMSHWMSVLISYAHHCRQRAQQQKYNLPEAEDALVAIQQGQPLNLFALGFDEAYQRVAEIWAARLPEELKAELEAQVMALSFFTGPERAGDIIREKGLKARPEQLADQILQQLPQAADLHVRLGMALTADTLRH